MGFEDDPRFLDHQISMDNRRLAIEEAKELRSASERNRELTLAEMAAGPKSWIEAFANPLVVAALAGVLALIGNAIVALVSNSGELSLARQKEQSELVLAALGSDDVSKVKENLRLLAEAKLITNATRRASILGYLDELNEGEGPGGLGQAQESISSEVRSTLGFTSESNWFVKMSRKAKYEKALGDGLRPIAVLGDGWQQYPLLLTDIGDWLGKEYAVYGGAAAGDCISEIPQQSENLPENLEFVLIGAGLCELLMDNSVLSAVNPYSDGQSPMSKLAQERLKGLQVELATIIEDLLIKAPNASFGIHGYDYPIVIQDGRLSKSLAERGYVGDDAANLIRVLIDDLNDMVYVLAEQEPRLSFIDLRGTLGRTD